MTIVFETPRLIARQWDGDRDAEAAFAMYGDPEVTRFIGGQVQPDVASTRAYLDEAIGRTKRLDPPWGAFPIFERETGALVGTSLMKPLPLSATRGANITHAVLSDDIEVGWHLRRSVWGRGYATEMGEALVARCFSESSVDVVYAVVDPENHRSMAVAKRIGLTHRGQTMRYYTQALELFSITRAEHEAR